MEHPDRTILLTRAAGDWFRTETQICLTGCHRGRGRGMNLSSFALSGGGGNY